MKKQTSQSSVQFSHLQFWGQHVLLDTNNRRCQNVILCFPFACLLLLRKQTCVFGWFQSLRFGRLPGNVMRCLYIISDRWLDESLVFCCRQCFRIVRRSPPHTPRQRPVRFLRKATRIPIPSSDCSATKPSSSSPSLTVNVSPCTQLHYHPVQDLAE